MNAQQYKWIIGVSMLLLALIFGVFYLLTPAEPSSTGNEPGAGSPANTNKYNVSVAPGSGSATDPGAGGSTEPGAGGPQTGSTPDVGRVSLEVKNGATVSARNFIKDPAVTQDSSNKGEYYIGYTLDPSVDVSSSEVAPYVIVYNDSTHFFTISLLREPISSVRKDAEQYLMKTLGINTAGMCALKYTVSVPNRVNSIYAGTNLGFSFCHGATVLP